MCYAIFTVAQKAQGQIETMKKLSSAKNKNTTSSLSLSEKRYIKTYNLIQKLRSRARDARKSASTLR